MQPLLAKYPAAGRYLAAHASVSASYEPPDAGRRIDRAFAHHASRHRALLSCAPSDPVRDSVRRMSEAGADAIAVVAADGALRGIVTGRPRVAAPGGRMAGGRRAGRVAPRGLPADPGSRGHRRPVPALHGRCARRGRGHHRRRPRGRARPCPRHPGRPRPTLRRGAARPAPRHRPRPVPFRPRRAEPSSASLPPARAQDPGGGGLALAPRPSLRHADPGARPPSPRPCPAARHARASAGSSTGRREGRSR
jgi:hypothetical protein